MREESAVVLIYSVINNVIFIFLRSFYSLIPSFANLRDSGLLVMIVAITRLMRFSWMCYHVQVNLDEILRLISEGSAKADTVIKGQYDLLSGAIERERRTQRELVSHQVSWYTALCLSQI